MSACKKQCNLRMLHVSACEKQSNLRILHVLRSSEVSRGYNFRELVTVFSTFLCLTGIEYTLGRIPMASCDFSTRPYSYDDHSGDFMLQNFTVALEDLKYKVWL